MDLEDRYTVCDLIESVIAADGVVDDREREFLQTIIRRFALPPRTKSASVNVGLTTAKLRALPSDVQTRVMALLVEAAVVDGKVDPHERAMLLASAATLGIEANALEERIAWRLRAVAAGPGANPSA